MADKKIRLKQQKQDGTYDYLFPATKSSIVDVNGKTLDVTLAETDGKITENNENFNAQLAQKDMLTNKQIKTINEIGDEYGLDIATFGNQGLAGDLLFINNRLHNYSDGTQLQVDNVGDGVMMLMRQSNNPSRRLDKPSTYVGNGTFIQFQRAKDNGSGVMSSTEFLLEITKDGDLLWRKERTAVMTNVKADDNTPAFRMQPQFQHAKVLELNYKLNTQLFEFKLLNNAANLIGGSTLTNGLRIQSIAGPVQLTGGNGQVILNGSALVYESATYQTIGTIRSGAREFRPSKPRVIGEFFFDTYLGKPIWCKTTAIVDGGGVVTTPAVWVDAAGAVV